MNNLKRKIKARLRPARPCEICGKIFILQPGFTMSGYGSTLCLECGTRKSMENMLSKEELDEFIEFMKEENRKNREFELI